MVTAARGVPTPRTASLVRATHSGIPLHFSSDVVNAIEDFDELTHATRAQIHAQEDRDESRMNCPASRGEFSPARMFACLTWTLRIAG